MISKKKEVAFIYNGLPNKYYGGSDLYAFSLVKCLSKSGLKVTCIPTKIFEYGEKKIFTDLNNHNIEYISNKNYYNNKNNNQKILKGFQKYLNEINHLFFSFNKIYNIKNLRNTINRILKDYKFDLLIVFDNDNIVAAESLKNKKIAIIGDPINLVNISRARDSIKFSSLKYLIILLYYKIYYVGYLSWLKKSLNYYDYNFTLSFYENQIYNRMNIKNCSHLHTLVDDLYIDNENINKNELSLSKTVVTILGDLGVNFNSIKIINKYLLPFLEKNCTEREIEIRIVGNIPKNIPNDINSILKNKFIKLTGFVEDIEDELQISDILFYAANHPIGVRTKIILAASFKCCIVTHSSSKKGIPELVDGVNCYSSSDYSYLCDKILNLHQDRDSLLYYKNKARKLYDEFYSPRNSSKFIKETIIPLLEYYKNE